MSTCTPSVRTPPSTWASAPLILICNLITDNLKRPAIGGTDEEIFEEINTKFPYYFDGTKSTVCAMRYKSVNEDESKESTLYILGKDEEGNILELRSLPNGVKDEVRVSEGKLIKRLNKITLNQLTYAGTIKRTNVDEIRYSRPDDMQRGTSVAYIEGFNYSTINADNISSIGNFYTNTSLKFIGFIVPKGTTKVEFESQTDMSATLIYQYIKIYLF